MTATTAVIGVREAGGTFADDVRAVRMIWKRGAGRRRDARGRPRRGPQTTRAEIVASSRTALLGRQRKQVGREDMAARKGAPEDEFQGEHDNAELEDERRPLHMVLCAPAYAGWQALADAHGLTLTGLLDALGHHAGAAAAQTEAELPPMFRLSVPFARRIDIQRRRSRP